MIYLFWTWYNSWEGYARQHVAEHIQINKYTGFKGRPFGSFSVLSVEYFVNGLWGRHLHYLIFFSGQWFLGSGVSLRSLLTNQNFCVQSAYFSPLCQNRTSLVERCSIDIGLRIILPDVAFSTPSICVRSSYLKQNIEMNQLYCLSNNPQNIGSLRKVSSCV